VLSEAADFRGWPTNGGFNLCVMRNRYISPRGTSDTNYLLVHKGKNRLEAFVYIRLSFRLLGR
jgi:hypothetical protein